MRVDRWVIPPAIAVAVFLTVALVPPGGPVARGLRVELGGEPTAGRPLLVRLAIEEAGRGQWRAPRAAQLRLANARGANTATATSTRGAPYLFAHVDAPDGAGPGVLEVSAEGYTARVPVALRAPRAPEPPREGAAGEGGVDVVIEGGALVPEVASTVLVRVAGGAGSDAELAAADPSLEVRPRRARLDACGVAAFVATVRGLDAHAVVRVAGAPARDAPRRLRVAPGGLAPRVDGAALVVTTAVGGRPAYVLAGDAAGPLRWSAALLDDPANDNATARVELAPGAQWALVSMSSAWESSAGLWTATPASATCSATPLGARFARAATPVPAPPRVDVAFDGAADALRAREARKLAARRAALAVAALGLAALIGMIATAGLQRDPDALRDVSNPARHRALVALAGAGALLLGGFVLVTAFLMRS